MGVAAYGAARARAKGKINVTSTLSVDKLCLPALEQGGGDAAERDTS